MKLLSENVSHRAQSSVVNMVESGVGGFHVYRTVHESWIGGKMVYRTPSKFSQGTYFSSYKLGWWLGAT